MPTPDGAESSGPAGTGFPGRLLLTGIMQRSCDLERLGTIEGSEDSSTDPRKAATLSAVKNQKGQYP